MKSRIHARQTAPPGTSGRRFAAPALSILAMLACSPGASAQSATNFDVSDVADVTAAEPAAAESKEAPQTPPKATAPGPVSLTPSRYVTPEDLESFVASMGAGLSIADRPTDPFGQYQDPNAKPVIRKTNNTPKRATPVYKATPFSDVVSLIRVSTVMPAENKFLIGDREVLLGERIPVSFRGKDMSIEVVDVSSSEIRFRNIENGEAASLKLNLLPPGMTPGVGGVITAPGMVPKDRDATIRLDGGLPDSESSLNP